MPTQECLCQYFTTFSFKKTDICAGGSTGQAAGNYEQKEYRVCMNYTLWRTVLPGQMRRLIIPHAIPQYT